jgi:hypothetical protein
MKIATLFSFFLLSLTGGAARAESEAVCRQYAQTAVDAFRQSQSLGPRCRFSNARWQANYDAHFAWCRNAPTLWVRNEEQFRANSLLVCRGDPKAVSCNEYAINAMSQQWSNLSGNCGFAGPRWQDDYDHHLGWCIVQPAEFAASEARERESLLSQCRNPLPGGSTGESGNTDPSNQRCVAECKDCTRDNLQCTSSIKCPIAAPWLCY